MENVTADNVSRQIEELEVLKSIYGDEWKQEVGGSSWSISLSEGPLVLELVITLTDVYPGDGPPLFQILAPCLTREEMIQITNSLQDIYLDNIGETVIYQWVEKAREWLQNTVELRIGQLDLSWMKCLPLTVILLNIWITLKVGTANIQYQRATL